MVRRGSRPIPDKLEASNHLSNREKSKDLRGDDTDHSELLSVDVADLGKNV
jgi:hypothetical protein